MSQSEQIDKPLASRTAILAIDQGTFSSRAVLFSSHGKCLYQAQQSVYLKRIDGQHVEQDAAEVLQSVLHCVQQLLDDSRQQGYKILCAGLATQRSSIIAWRPSCGKAISALLSWQDTRAASLLPTSRKSIDLIRQRSGLRMNAHYGASKIRWLLQNNHQVQQYCQQQDCVITPLASYLLYHLIERHPCVIDIANASRTMLCNLYQKDWDADLLKLFGLTRTLLPAIQPIRHDYGTLIDTDIPVTAVNGDQTAAMYSQGEPAKDILRVNIGTGAFILKPLQQSPLTLPPFIPSGLLAGISDDDGEDQQFYIEGTVNGAASALNWLQQQLRNFSLQKNRQPNFSDVSPLIFINSIGGLGSPFWRSAIKPYFIGRPDIQAQPLAAWAGVLESIVFLLQSNLEIINRINSAARHIVISGGLSQSDYLCQKLANLSGLKVQRWQDSEATARGIAWQALKSSQRALWEKQQKADEFRVQSDAGLQRRYQQFRRELEQELC